uniref:ULP_PROTEASE domain-containing protein n=1 Tax=Haemonchus placei TaxID=6290 RepID=A0A0N4XBL9_HAEPC
LLVQSAKFCRCCTEGLQITDLYCICHFLQSFIDGNTATTFKQSRTCHIYNEIFHQEPHVDLYRPYFDIECGLLWRKQRRDFIIKFFMNFFQRWTGT